MSEEPDRTQWSEDGLSAADRKADQLVQQHWGFWSRDHDSMAALWLQRRSTTEECLTKIVLKEGRWHGTWC